MKSFPALSCREVHESADVDLPNIHQLANQQRGGSVTLCHDLILWLAKRLASSPSAVLGAIDTLLSSVVGWDVWGKLVMNYHYFFKGHEG